MSTRASHSRSLFGYRWPAVPRDYFLRRRMFRRIFNVVLAVILSVLVAGAILYTSNPGAFPPAGK